jgi:hypothetical protein
MSDPSRPASSQAAPEQGNPYVIEHYGFAGPRAADEAAPSVVLHELPARHSRAGKATDAPKVRRRRVLAAAAISLALVGGVGGVAAAATESGPDGRDADRAGNTLHVGPDAGGLGGGVGRGARTDR